MKTRNFFTVLIIVFLYLGNAEAQHTPWKAWTFLEEKYIDEIVGELSGERAHNHMFEMAAYNKNRPESEYGDGTFYEAEYVLRKLKEYNLAGARIERFPGGQTWDVGKGTLWEVSPKRQKLADYEEVPAMLARNSQSANISAELVWVGEGRQQDFEGLDLTGKIAVSYATANTIVRHADPLGAVGVISLYSPRPTFDPKQILWSSVRPGQNVKFGFFIPPHNGLPLKDRLVRGEKITVEVDVQTQMLPYEIQDPTCYIPGTDPNGDEIILTAHLFEGYAKQGANDDISGSSVLLEIARTMKTLIDEGRIPRPKRTIRFLWVPEFSGSRPWAAANPELMQRTLCNINMDMVGAWLTKNYSYYSVMRTTYGNPHYINDVVESYLRYVGQTNREILQNRRGNKIIKPIVAPTGSNEPFYYSIETHYGSSDHEVFNALNVRVPGVLMITWPDQFYHTSQDRPDKADPTQLKRASFITLASAYTIAIADDAVAMEIAGEVTGNGNSRIAHQFNRGIELLKQANVENFIGNYRRARNHIEASAINEKATLETVLELVTDETSVSDFIGNMSRSIDRIRDANLFSLDAFAEVTARRIGVRYGKIKATDLEKKAAKVIPKPLQKLTTFSRNTVRQNLDSEIAAKYPTNRVNVNEINLLVNGKNSALDIKKMLDVQFRDEADLQGVLNHLEILRLLEMIGN